jgi:tetratricopeptide (TPR) repeat protein
MTLGETDRVATVGGDYQALADELKQPSHQWYVAVMRTVRAAFRGNLAEAEEAAEAAHRHGERALSLDAEISYRLALFFLRREQGRLAEIEDVMRRAAAEYRGYRAYPCLVAAMVCELGRADEARRLLDELARDDFSSFPRDGEWLFCLCTLAEVASSLGDRDRANVLYELLAPYPHLNPMVSGEFALGSVARYLGLLASTTGRWGEAELHFEDALAANSRMGARPWLAHTQHDYARMLLARAGDDDDRASELLAAARRTAVELGMNRLRDRIDSLPVPARSP